MNPQALDSHLPLFGLIADQARLRPETVAVVQGSQQISFLALAAGSMKLANALKQQGVAQGMRVGLSMQSSPMALMSLLAMALLGACAVPLSLGRSPQNRAEIAAKYQVSVVLTDIAAGKLQGYSSLELTSIQVSPQDLASTQQQLAQSTSEQYQHLASQEWFVVLSSGSTGVPKGVALTQAQARVRVSQCMLAWKANTRVLPYELAIGAGLFPALRSLAAGGCVVVTNAQDFEQDFARFVNEHRATHVMSSPWMAEQLLRQLERADAKHAMPTVQYLWIAGGHCSRAVLEGLMERATPNVWMVYASAETGILAGSPASELLEHAGLTGTLGDWLEAEVVDEQGQVLNANQVGILRFRAKGWPQAYAHVVDNTETPFAQGWYRSSDRGRIDDQRRVFGRADGFVNVAGMRIDPYQLEPALIQKLGLEECAIFASLQKDGTSVLTVAIRESQQSLKDRVAKELVALLNSPVLVSIRVECMKSLPRNALGKIARYELQRMFSVQV
jgi:acyl-coenzyme A synthetase/AMP-(fatty) acid ligase